MSKKIFISWSGKLSAKIANSLKVCLDANAKVETWISMDIHPGTRWCDEILDALSESDCAILCITPDNINSSWLAFEAGAIAQRGLVVVPFLFNVSPKQLGNSPLVNWQAINSRNELECKRFFADACDIEDEIDKTRASNEFWKLISQELEKLHEQYFAPEGLAFSIEAALRELRDIGDKLTRTHYVQTFPSYIRAVINPCIEKAENELLIACDFPAYGCFSDYEAYRQYEAAICELRKKRKKVSLLIPDDGHRERLVRRQFLSSTQDLDDLKRDSKEFERLLREFEGRIGVEVRTTEDFIQRALGLQQVALRDLQDSRFETKCEVHQVAKILPMHLWIVDNREAVFSFPMYSPDTFEHGIKTTDTGLVKALREIWNELYQPSI